MTDVWATERPVLRPGQPWGRGDAAVAARAVAEAPVARLDVPALSARIRPECTPWVDAATSLNMTLRRDAVVDPGGRVGVQR